MKMKFVGKYMRLAKQVGEDKNPCGSRCIGVIIVDCISNKIVGTGYNGPPRGVPHNDDPEYLKEMVWPQLTEVEKQNSKCSNSCEFSTLLGNSGACPRKVVKAESGKRLELCSCVHAETNAIINASTNLNGATMFCWCGIPCVECTKLIINCGIKRIYTLKWPTDYSYNSRWLLKKAQVETFEESENFYLEV